MNKATPKEPSMDEILSSIRQIIADDDAAMPSRRLAAANAAAPLRRFGEAMPLQPRQPEPEPLVLSETQIVDDEVEGRQPPEDFASEPETGPEPDYEPVSAAADEPVVEDQPFLPPPPVPAAAPQRPEPPGPPEPRFMPPPQPRFVAQTAPLPDPKLTSDIAEQLLEPTTKAAVRQNLAKLNSLPLGSGNVTIEGMVREMLRPMLKDWLDEHLPSLVERMVEKEIARISRGE